MLILLCFVLLGKDEKPNDINERIVKSDRLLVQRFLETVGAFELRKREFHAPHMIRISETLN